MRQELENVLAELAEQRKKFNDLELNKLLDEQSIAELNEQVERETGVAYELREKVGELEDKEKELKDLEKIAENYYQTSENKKPCEVVQHADLEERLLEAQNLIEELKKQLSESETVKGEGSGTVDGKVAEEMVDNQTFS